MFRSRGDRSIGVSIVKLPLQACPATKCNIEHDDDDDYDDYDDEEEAQEEEGWR